MENSSYEKRDSDGLASVSEIWFHNFWKMMTYNLLWVLVNLPIAIIIILFGNILYSIFFPSFAGLDNYLLSVTGLDLAEVDDIVTYLYTHGILFLTIFFMGNLFLVVSPMQCSFTSIFSKHIEEDHVFLGYELKKIAKENFKKSLAHQLIQVFLAILFPMSVFTYRRLPIPEAYQGFIFSILIFILVFTCMMQAYIYQMMIQFELKLKDIYKNAFILVWLNLPKNLLCFLAGNIVLLFIPIAMLFLLPKYSFQITLLYSMFFSFSLCQTIFYRNAKKHINKYLL